MKKKKILVLLTLVAVIAIPFSVFAAASDAPVARCVRGFFGIDTSKLTDHQKADVKDYLKKMANLQKEFINKMVANGSITKEQGDAAIKKVDDMLKNQEENGFICGIGMGKAHWEGYGRRGVPGVIKTDPSKLTDQQKADLAEYFKKMTDLYKEYINKMIANGLMTKEQGDAATKKVDYMAKNFENNGMVMGRGGFGGFGFLGIKRIDTSKLTDQQKADLTDFRQKMTDLQKELINKMVANGLMTKEQGDAAVKKIDDMLKYSKENGFTSKMKMWKGRFGGRGK